MQQKSFGRPRNPDQTIGFDPLRCSEERAMSTAAQSAQAAILSRVGSAPGCWRAGVRRAASGSGGDAAKHGPGSLTRPEPQTLASELRLWLSVRGPRTFRGPLTRARLGSGVEVPRSGAWRPEGVRQPSSGHPLVVGDASAMDPPRPREIRRRGVLYRTMTDMRQTYIARSRTISTGQRLWSVMVVWSCTEPPER